MKNSDKKNSKKETSIIKAVFWGLVFYIWDALIFGLPIIGVFISAVAFLSNGIYAIVKLKKNQGDIARKLVWKAGIYLITIIAIFTTVLLNVKMAETNAKRVITAVQDYRTEHGKYPETLGDLVPKYFDKVPIASVRLSGNFIYKSGNKHQLILIKVPPFLKRVYDFDTNQWQTID